MREMAPELLMVVLAAVYLAQEALLRRRSRWREGVLDHAGWPVIVPPLVVFLVAALVLSTGGWSLLSVPGVLVVLGLPIALGAGVRAARGHRDADPDRVPGTERLLPVLVALAVSVLGLLAVWWAH